jgi:hypothetical protein
VSGEDKVSGTEFRGSVLGEDKVSARIRCQEPNLEVLCSTVGTDTRVFERGIATGRRMGGDDSVSSVLSLLTSGALRLWPGGRTSVPGHPPPTPNQRADKVSLNSRCILEERPCPLQQVMSFGRPHAPSRPRPGEAGMSATPGDEFTSSSLQSPNRSTTHDLVTQDRVLCHLNHPRRG